MSKVYQAGGAQGGCGFPGGNDYTGNAGAHNNGQGQGPQVDEVD